MQLQAVDMNSESQLFPHFICRQLLKFFLGESLKLFQLGRIRFLIKNIQQHTLVPLCFSLKRGNYGGIITFPKLTNTNWQKAFIFTRAVIGNTKTGNPWRRRETRKSRNISESPQVVQQHFFKLTPSAPQPRGAAHSPLTLSGWEGQVPVNLAMQPRAFTWRTGNPVQNYRLSECS